MGVGEIEWGRRGDRVGGEIEWGRWSGGEIEWGRRGDRVGEMEWGRDRVGAARRWSGDGEERWSGGRDRNIILSQIDQCRLFLSSHNRVKKIM